MIEYTPEEPGLVFRREGNAYHLDVRELLAAGGQPYQAIMDCVAQIEGDDRLVLHAPFRPAPLLKQLERLGLAVHTEQSSADHWVVTICEA